VRGARDRSTGSWWTGPRRREHVVRLKGGGPRGLRGASRDEIEAVRSAGIAFEVIPGVTAAVRGRRAARHLASPARERLGTLVSRRAPIGPATLGRRSTGTCLARAEGTLVFYMPVARSRPSLRRLTMLGRDRASRRSFVERVGTPGERVIASRLGDIAEGGRARGVAAPRVLITRPTGRGRCSVPATCYREREPNAGVQRCRLLPRSSMCGDGACLSSGGGEHRPQRKARALLDCGRG